MCAVILNPICILFLFAQSAIPPTQPVQAESVFVRGFAPQGAVLRSGRSETLVAVLKLVQATPTGVTVRLEVSPGVEILGDPEIVVTGSAPDEIVRTEWRVKADAPVRGRAKLVVRDPTGAIIDSNAIPIRFEAPIELASEEYVPVPRPVESDRIVLAHYCPLWKYGAHSMGWDTIEPWPERRPAIGFYDEGTPLVADWHIKYALEHGVDGFVFTWDKIWLDSTITNSLGDGLNNGFLQARYLDKAKFCINWADQYYASSREELLNEIFPFWLDHYFKHPSYVRIGGRPVLFITHAELVTTWLGGIEETRAVFDELRSRCRQDGLGGLIIVGCVPTAEPKRLRAIAAAGYDATSAYILWTDLWSESERDREGIPTFSHESVMKAHGDLLKQRQKLGVLPDVVTVQMGWDPRPWHGLGTTYYMAGVSVENFEHACRAAGRLVDANDRSQIDGQLVVLDNWNEFGEGHFIEPTAGFGFGFLDAVKRVFCRESAACTHIVPTDLPLARPDRVFQHCRGILHDPYRRDRDISDHLVASWRFDGADEQIASDSSAVGLHALKHHVASVPGVRGHALQPMQYGYAIVGVDRLLYPKDGLTVAFWYKTDEHQDDVFLLNTATEKNTGYGIGLRGGKLAFYLNWTQLAETQAAAPLGRWTHVAAVCDNRTMAIYVDGVEMARSPYGQSVRAPSKGVACIGAYAPGARSFSGAIDELEIHQKALTPIEIEQAATRYK